MNLNVILNWVFNAVCSQRGGIFEWIGLFVLYLRQAVQKLIGEMQQSEQSSSKKKCSESNQMQCRECLIKVLVTAISYHKSYLITFN